MWKEKHPSSYVFLGIYPLRSILTYNEGTENFSLYPLRWRVYIYRELLKEKV